MKNGLPVLLAVAFGVLALIGMLLVASLGQIILGWASLLAAFALLLGLGNLFLVHLKRAIRANPYSLLLILSMGVVFLAGVADLLGLTESDFSQQLFEWLQRPLETAFSSLLAFFLVFAGFRLLQRRRDGWSVLFLVTVIVLLLPVPGAAANLFTVLRNLISDLFVTAGLRGLLIGIALGIITLSLRLLVGSERPYSK